MKLIELLTQAVRQGGSDIYIIPGSPIVLKIGGLLHPVSENKILPPDSEMLLREIYAMESRQIDTLIQTGDDDFSFSLQRIGRFRCNAYKQRGSLAAVLRVVPFGLPNANELEIPDAVMRLSTIKRGMVLITGPAGSGKSTTLACLVDKINHESADHIITLEDPLEYLHSHCMSIVSQREITHDTISYANALRAALRQAPDVILLGEMRDFETIQTALTAAETGHLLLSSLHTVGAAKTIDRIIDVFPANQQQQVRIQLSMVLQAVVSQQLIPTLDGNLAPAFEIMIVNNAIRNMIREEKVYQMDNVIYAGASQSMQTMDSDILRLYQAKRISRENALLYATTPDTLARKLT